MNITPEIITTLQEHEVFVFGSNEAGRHGKGAAKAALAWGAKRGQAEGLQGRTYGIPTKDSSVRRTLSIKEIKPYVDRFIEFASNTPSKMFYVTEIGCGLAGYKPEDIAPLFKSCLSLSNVYLPLRFHNLLK